MKYSIVGKGAKEKAKFQPFTISLEIETEEEYVKFHDKIMGRIANVIYHDFYGHVFQVGRNEIGRGSGEIETFLNPYHREA